MKIDGVALPANRGPDADQRLRAAAKQLEGVFIHQLFKAMRETIPEGGLMSGGTGEEMFTEMLDQQFAGSLADRLDRGIGAALYRQLRPLVEAANANNTGR